jgi:hypothetical protein
MGLNLPQSGLTSLPEFANPFWGKKQPRGLRRATMQSNDLKVRLPIDLGRWVADEAFRGRTSMNAVVVDAVASLKATRTERHADAKHAAAIERAITLATLPTGAGIILKPHNNGQMTEILVCKPSAAEYSVLARVSGENIVFADDPVTAGAGRET